jgi:hypothetical protein
VHIFFLKGRYYLGDRGVDGEEVLKCFLEEERENMLNGSSAMKAGLNGWRL